MPMTYTTPYARVHAHTAGAHVLASDGVNAEALVEDLVAFLEDWTPPPPPPPPPPLYTVRDIVMNVEIVVDGETVTPLLDVTRSADRTSYFYYQPTMDRYIRALRGRPRDVLILEVFRAASRAGWNPGYPSVALRSDLNLDEVLKSIEYHLTQYATAAVAEEG